MIPGLGAVSGLASAAMPMIGEALKMGTEAMKLGGELIKAMSKKDEDGDQKDKVGGDDTHNAHGPVNISVNNDTNISY